MRRPYFPCLDKHAARQRLLESPEPNYQNIVSGYRLFEHKNPFEMVHGSLSGFTLAYETWGKLNAAKNNAILLCTGLSASSHAKSHSSNPANGWWENYIGPDRYIDTKKYHVICTNVLGGCYGSTGPSSVDPITSKRHGTNFPMVTIYDMVHAQFKLLDHLGIDKLHACVGSSMGGMQSLASAALFPNRVGKLVSVSAAARSHPYSMALRFTQRQSNLPNLVLMSDPNWNRGFYYDGVAPHVGMKLARYIATVSYRSGPEWEERFGRARDKPNELPTFCADYLIETYLDHQAEKFCLTFDPNSLLYISKAMDMFTIGDVFKVKAKILGTKDCDTDTSDEHQRLLQGAKEIQMPTLILGAQSDILFPVWQQKEIAELIQSGGNPNTTYYELTAKYGHDTFLIDERNVGAAIKGHLEM